MSSIQIRSHWKKMSVLFLALTAAMLLMITSTGPAFAQRHQTIWVKTSDDQLKKILLLPGHLTDEHFHLQPGGPNKPPTANDDTVETKRNEPVEIRVLENDEDSEDSREELTIVDILESPENGTTTINEDSITYTPEKDFIGEDSFRYTIEDTGGKTDDATVYITVNDHFVYMPYFGRALVGEVAFSSNRSQGMTTFVPNVTLDFSDFNFDEDYLPNMMRVWLGSETEPTGWDISFREAGYTHDLDPTQFGAQQINVRFRFGDRATPIFTETIFYIPNGDFQDSNLDQWVVTEDDLPVGVTGGDLRLGNPDIDCREMPFPAMAGVGMIMEMANEGDYALRVSATIHTRDQLPNPDDSTYDAFEVHLNGAISRFGNPESGLGCSLPERIVNVDGTWSLQNGQPLGLSMENHSRFDNFYNTYTYIHKVWVDKR